MNLHTNFNGIQSNSGSSGLGPKMSGMSPRKRSSPVKVLGDYHLTKINKAFANFWYNTLQININEKWMIYRFNKIIIIIYYIRVYYKQWLDLTLTSLSHGLWETQLRPMPLSVTFCCSADSILPDKSTMLASENSTTREWLRHTKDS